MYSIYSQIYKFTWKLQLFYFKALENTLCKCRQIPLFHSCRTAVLQKHYLYTHCTVANHHYNKQINNKPVLSTNTFPYIKLIEAWFWLSAVSKEYSAVLYIGVCFPDVKKTLEVKKWYKKKRFFVIRHNSQFDENVRNNLFDDKQLKDL